MANLRATRVKKNDEMIRDESEALAILGLDKRPTEVGLRMAYAKALLAIHPDTAAREENPLLVKKIMDARDFLKALTKHGSLACRMCGGRGTVGAGFGGARICGQCAGTGEQR